MHAPAFFDSPYAVPPLLAAFLNFALVLWVLLQAAPGRVRRTFILWSFALGLWNLGIAVGYSLKDPGQALDWYRLGVTSIVRFLPPFFLQFVMAITNTWRERKNRAILATVYAVMIAFLIMGAATPALITAVHHYRWGYYPEASGLEEAFGLPFALTVFYGFFLLYNAVRQSSGYRRNQMKYLFAGAVLCFGGGFTNFLPFYGVQVYPLGNLVNSFYSFLVAYAMIRYELTDIRLALRRGTVYTLVAGALTLLYVAITSILQKFFSRYGLGDGLAFYSAVVPFMVALAPALKTHIELLIGRVPFWRTPNYDAVLSEFGPSLFSGLDVTTACRQALEKAVRLFHAKGGAVYLTGQNVWMLERAVASGASSPLILHDIHPIVTAIREGVPSVMKEKMLWDIRRRPSTINNAQSRKHLEIWPYTVVAPLYDHANLLGFLALEDKMSGAMFNEEDLTMLRAVCRSTATSLRSTQRAADLERIGRVTKKHDDMVIMGVVATEMAHELSKPLTHIMNTGSRMEPILNESAREGLAKIERAAQRASDILDSFVKLAPGSALSRETVFLGALIDDALTTLGLHEEASIQIERQYDALPTARVHAGQMIQVYTNILQNAWQAMPDGGRLRIRIRNDSLDNGPAALIQIEDTGEGIPAYALSHVFDLFFTTKKAQGGQGIGLTLSRAMVERHGGRMTVESPIENGRGTRISIRLPLDQGDTYAD